MVERRSRHLDVRDPLTKEFSHFLTFPSACGNVVGQNGDEWFTSFRDDGVGSPESTKDGVLSKFYPPTKGLTCNPASGHRRRRLVQRAGREQDRPLGSEDRGLQGIRLARAPGEPLRHRDRPKPYYLVLLARTGYAEPSGPQDRRGHRVSVPTCGNFHAGAFHRFSAGVSGTRSSVLRTGSATFISTTDPRRSPANSRKRACLTSPVELGGVMLVLGTQARSLFGAAGLDEILRSSMKRHDIPVVVAMLRPRIRRSIPALSASATPLPRWTLRPPPFSPSPR